MANEEQPFENLDMSFMLRTIMTARGLTVSDMAEMAGVSKSAMEKYLSGPSSPRAVAIASLSRSLSISADTIMFGEINGQTELAYRLMFQSLAHLIKKLKTDKELSERFASLDAGSEEFADFVRDLAFEQAGLFRREFNQDRHELHFTTRAL